MGNHISLYMTKCLNPSCGRDRKIRGLCQNCYAVALTLVRNGTKTWKELEIYGRSSPLPNKRSRGSIKKWLMSTISDQEYKPDSCPFCKSDTVRVLESENKSKMVVCTWCGASGPTSGSDYDAVSYWNDRAINQPHQKGESK